MGSSAGPLRGRVLRAGREYAGLSVSELSARAQMSTSTLSMWEHGSRGRRAAASLETAKTIVGSLGLPGEQATALADLWRSAGSDEALPPRTVWSHNFRAPSGPAWAWLRPE